MAAISTTKQNQISAKARLERLENEIRMYSKEIEDINNKLVQIQLNQPFYTAVLELTLIANNIRNYNHQFLLRLWICDMAKSAHGY